MVILTILDDALHHFGILRLVLANRRRWLFADAIPSVSDEVQIELSLNSRQIGDARLWFLTTADHLGQKRID
jgi:hypothetical protein